MYSTRKIVSNIVISAGFLQPVFGFEACPGRGWVRGLGEEEGGWGASRT